MPEIPQIIFPGSVMSPTAVNRSYQANIQATGGLTPYTFDVSAGSLPPGLSLNQATGQISGTPTTAGSFNFTLRVTDANSNTGTLDTVLTVAPESPGFVYTRTPSGSPVTSPLDLRIQGVFGLDFCQDTRAEGYAIDIYIPGTFGSGGIFIPSQGLLTHTQGEVVDDTVQIGLAPGTYSVAIACQSFSVGGWLVTHQLEGFIVPAISVYTSNLAEGLLGEIYSQNIQTSGGTSPFSWSVISGSLPSGLVLNSSTGQISGTPTTIETANFTVQVTDANNNMATKDLSIVVHGNTSVGNPVVGPLNGVTLTFTGGVTQEGQTTVTTSGVGQPPPTGFKLGNPPTYYSISTTAVFNPPVEVCISWAEGQFNNENNLKLFHLEGTNWVNVTTSLDTASNIICGTANSLSDFAVFEKKQVVASIDIKPGSYPNSINLGSGGTVPVAIFSTSEFDARAIDPLTVTLASAPVKLRGNGTSMSSSQDVNNDGLLDMVVHVSTESFQLSSTDEVANLVGYTPDSTEVIGSDTVRIVP